MTVSLDGAIWRAERLAGVKAVQGSQERAGKTAGDSEGHNLANRGWLDFGEASREAEVLSLRSNGAESIVRA